jgi:hypothetical protein
MKKEQKRRKEKKKGSGREEYKKREGKYGREWFQLDLFPVAHRSTIYVLAVTQHRLYYIPRGHPLGSCRYHGQ